MTDLTRIFIPGPSDEANARLFKLALSEGSEAAQRAAREDAGQLATLMQRLGKVAPRLWGVMQADMRRLIDEARQQRGYADMADIVRKGYSEAAIEMYLKAQKPAPNAAPNAAPGPAPGDEAPADLPADLATDLAAADYEWEVLNDLAGGGHGKTFWGAAFAEALACWQARGCVDISGRLTDKGRAAYEARRSGAGGRQAKS